MNENKETIENMLLLLQYNEYQWVVMGDLKVVNILMCLKSGYYKYPCLFCKFDSQNSYIDFDLNYNWDDRVEDELSSLFLLLKSLYPCFTSNLVSFNSSSKFSTNPALFFISSAKNPKTEAKMLQGILTGP